MTKRFTDTEKWKKKFVRKLDPRYKLLWVYLLDECSHAGIWDVDLDVASLRLGVEYDVAKSLQALNKHVVPFHDNEKWFIPAFIEFQYGTLNPDNRAHQSVICQLVRYGLQKTYLGACKPLKSPFQGAKVKDKDKSHTKIQPTNEVRAIYWAYPRHVAPQAAYGAILKALAIVDGGKLLEAVSAYARAVEGHPDITKIPHCATWMNQHRWLDDRKEWTAWQAPAELHGGIAP